MVGVNTYQVIAPDIMLLPHVQSQQPIFDVGRVLQQYFHLLIAFEVAEKAQVILGICRGFDEGVARANVVVMTENEKLEVWALPESLKAQKACVRVALHDKIVQSRGIRLC
jgi:hypothetical protein